MFEKIEALSKIGSIIWSQLQPKKGTRKRLIKTIISSIEKATEKQYDILKRKIKIEKFESSKDLKNFIYWDIKGLSKYFEYKLSLKNGLVFQNDNPETIASDIITHFYLAGHSLDKSELQLLIMNIVNLAQELFRENISVDIGLVNYTQFLQEQQGTHLQNLDLILEKVYEHNVSDTEESEDFTSNYNRCTSLYKDGKFVECNNNINSLLEKGSWKTEELILFKLLQVGIYYYEYNYNKAHQLLLEVEEKININIEIQFLFLGLKGSLLSDKGYYEKSKKLVELGLDCLFQQLDILSETEDFANHTFVILYNIGTSFLNLDRNEGDIRDSVDFFENALEIRQTAELYKNLGSAYGKLHKYNEEIDCYEKALELNPNLYEAQIAMGMVKLRYYNNPIQALEFYNKALKNKEMSYIFPYGYYWAAECHYLLEDFDNALLRVNMGLKLSPTDKWLLGMKEKVMYEQVNLNPQKYATEYIDFVFKEYEKPAEELYEKILMSYLLIKEYKKGEELIRNLPEKIRISPYLYKIYVLFATEIIVKSKSSNVNYFLELIDEKKIEDQKILGSYYFLKASHSKLNEEHSNAIQYYNKLLNSKSSIVEKYYTHMMMGASYLELGQYSEARKCFMRAQKQAPNPIFEIEMGLFETSLRLGRLNVAYTALKEIFYLTAIDITDKAFDGKISETIEMRIELLSLFIDNLASAKAQEEVLQKTDEDEESYYSRLDEKKKTYNKIYSNELAEVLKSNLKVNQFLAGFSK